MRTRTLTTALLLAIAPWASAQTQDLPYSSGSTGADGPLDIPGVPAMRYSAASAYDEERDRVVIFGGLGRNSINNSPSIRFGDTMTFDGASWAAESPATVPAARYSAAMGYDAVRKKVVMFGGFNTSSQRLSETWTWDGTDWTREFPAVSPPAGTHGKMVWDAGAGRILMFGSHLNSTTYRSLWSWDGGNWSEITTATEVGTTSPSPTYNALAYDPVGDRTILYNELLRQTWAFDGTDWAQITTTASPDTGLGCSMVYDVARDEIVFFGGGGSAQTWVFKNDDWSIRSPATTVRGRSHHGMVYIASSSKVAIFCGDGGSWATQETDTWDGTDWTNVSGRSYTFDMSGRPDGVWNFTSINVPPHRDIYFTKNSTNTAVTWLATEDVNIGGRVILSGQSGVAGSVAQGGPGGANGGTGGVPGSLLGQYAGSPGAGPGGGAPGITRDEAGGHATHRTTYGNALVQPPTGGSGGGGGGADDHATGVGGNGGAGGGAIVIKTSRDFYIPRGNTSLPPGSIYVNGGNAHNGLGGSWGGAGSAGSIRIVADRVIGDGTLQAFGGHLASTRRGGDGWIRVESYFQPFGLVSQPAASVVSPVGTITFGDQPKLTVITVAGETVPQPPTASIETPDVIFANSATPVSIIVQGTNVPVGTEITLTIETPSGPVNLPGVGDPPVTLAANGTAVFNTVLEDGHGTIRAFANYQVQP